MALAFVGGGLVGLGVGLADTLANDVIIATAPPERAGAAAGISESAYELGGAIGTAVLGSIGASTYRSELEAGLPQAFPPELAQAARETLGNAVHIAGELPGEYTKPFLDLANKAFVHGMDNAFTIAAVIVGLTAASAAIILRSHAATPHE